MKEETSIAARVKTERWFHLNGLFANLEKNSPNPKNSKGNWDRERGGTWATVLSGVWLAFKNSFHKKFVLLSYLICDSGNHTCVTQASAKGSELLSCLQTTNSWNYLALASLCTFLQNDPMSRGYMVTTNLVFWIVIRNHHHTVWFGLPLLLASARLLSATL